MFLRHSGSKFRLTSKIYSSIILGLIAVVLVVVFTSQPTLSMRLRVGGTTYALLVADNPAAQEKGLGNRTSLAQKEGMIFIFSKPSKVCFWMKDMRFSIDMIWLNEQKQVVYIKNNVSPDTYPTSYCPPKPAKYVIELRVGEASRQAMQLGQSLNITAR